MPLALELQEKFRRILGQITTLQALIASGSTDIQQIRSTLHSLLQSIQTTETVTLALLVRGPENYSVPRASESAPSWGGGAPG